MKVYLTGEEADVLAAKAVGVGVSLSRMVAELALGEGRQAVTQRNAERELLLRVQRKLTGATTNLNQLAKVANTTGRVPPEVPEAAVAVARLEGEVAEALGRVRGR